MKQLPELFDLSGRVAVVTGGAGLLGEEFCRTLIGAGANTVIADIDEAAAKKIAASLNQPIILRNNPLRDLSNQVLPIGVDVTSKKSVENLMRRTVAELGRLDILVNSAALDPKFDLRGEEDTGGGDDPHSLKFEEFPLESWNQAIDVNLTGMFLCCQSAGRQMRARERE